MNLRWRANGTANPKSRTVVLNPIFPEISMLDRAAVTELALLLSEPPDSAADSPGKALENLKTSLLQFLYFTD